MKECIIIPAYNEGDRIASVIEGIRKHSAADTIVINDGSSDLTGEKARAQGAHVITHPFNLGYGVALQTGYKYAVRGRYESLVQMDADGQHDPKCIPDLFRAVESGECDVALGSRFLHGDKYPLGTFKAMGIALLRFVLRLATGRRITDPTSGFQCLSQKVMNLFTQDIFPCDYPDANVILLLHRMGYRVQEIPVAMVPNQEGRSMHRGVFKVMYYFFTMSLSFLIYLMREKRGRGV